MCEWGKIVINKGEKKKCVEKVIMRKCWLEKKEDDLKSNDNNGIFQKKKKKKKKK
jgi:hypothetical protein